MQPTLAECINWCVSHGINTPLDLSKRFECEAHAREESGRTLVSLWQSALAQQHCLTPPSLADVIAFRTSRARHNVRQRNALGGRTQCTKKTQSINRPEATLMADLALSWAPRAKLAAGLNKNSAEAKALHSVKAAQWSIHEPRTLSQCRKEWIRWSTFLREKRA